MMASHTRKAAAMEENLRCRLWGVKMKQKVAQGGGGKRMQSIAHCISGSVSRRA